jgi:hypothetical protein
MFSYAFDMPCSSNPPSLDYPSAIWRGVQTTKLLITQLPLRSSRLRHFMSKYFHQHCVLEHPESTFYPLVEKQICIHIKNRKICTVLMFTLSHRRREKDSEKSDNISGPLNLPSLDFFVNILLAFQSFSLVPEICTMLHFRKLYYLYLFLFDFIVHSGNQTWT